MLTVKEKERERERERERESEAERERASYGERRQNEGETGRQVRVTSFIKEFIRKRHIYTYYVA